MRFNRLFRRLKSRARFEREMGDELRDHLERRAADLERGGLSRDEAHRRARIEFGSVESCKEKLREGREWAWLRNLPEQLGREFVLAWRRIRSAPGPTVFAMLTLAAGIGAVVATYSVVYTVLWRPLGVADEDRIALMGRTNSLWQRSGQFSWRDYQMLLSEPHGFQGIAAWSRFSSVLATEGTAELIEGEVVTGNYFPLVGVTPLAGRMLGPDDDRPEAASVAVISASTWRMQFGADRATVGRTIKIADQPFQVVGVAPDGFRGLNPDGVIVRNVWLPMAAAPRMAAWLERAVRPGVRDSYGTFTIALRLAPGQTMAAAASSINALSQRLDASDPLPKMQVPGTGLIPTYRYWTARPVSDDQTVNAEDQMGRLIIGLPALVLLIACTNIANLVLSRGVARRHDFGVRRALGASRWRLIREQMVEQAAIIAIGGVGGILIAYKLVRFVSGLARETIAPFARGLQFDWTLDAGVLSSSAVAVLIALVVAGLIPALHLTRDSLRTVLDQGSTVSTPRWRGRANLVAVQVGVSVGLFLIAVIFVRMIVEGPGMAAGLITTTPGSERVAVATIPFGIQHRDQERANATVDRILKDLSQSPDVTAAAAASDQPFGQFVRVGSFLRADVQLSKPMTTSITAVSPEYFAAMGVPLVHGRPFSDADDGNAAPVAIVNEGFALDAFGTADIVGRRMSVVYRDQSDSPARPVDTEIVGVSPGTDRADRSGRRVHQLYVPLAQEPVPNVAILARAAGDRLGAADALQAAIKKVDPELAVAALGRADVLERGPLAFLGYLATTLSALSFLALGMAMAGLYGVLSHVMARRSREMGIRIAIGANTSRIIRLVLRDGFRPVVEGLFIGLATATVVRLFLRYSLNAPNIAPLDPLACVLAGVLVTAAGALACYLPARRAASVDPNVALRNL